MPAFGFKATPDWYLAKHDFKMVWMSLLLDQDIGAWAKVAHAFATSQQSRGVARTAHHWHSP
eukprot:1375081-Prorocentrum_lima.AAC.1